MRYLDHIILAAVAAACLLAAVAANAACPVTKADLQQVNDAVNPYCKTPYKGTRWEGIETFVKRGGNCADCSQAKRWVLYTKFGCSIDDMPMVDGLGGGVPHRLMSVNTTDGVWYMDNRVKPVTRSPKDFK